MKLAEMIAAGRRDTDDIKVPYLASDEDWTRFANWAETEAARRGRLILDSSTPQVCTLNIGIAADSVDLHESILFIRRAMLVGRTIPLRRWHAKDLDCERPGWESETGEITGFVTGLTDGKFRPYPIPTAASVVKLTVARLPLEPMEDEDDEPELRKHLHEALIHGMRYRFYNLQDTEIANPKLADKAMADFELEFGKKSSALDEQWLAREADHYEFEGQF